MIVYVMRWTWMRFFPILLIGKDALHVKGPFWYIFKLFLIWDIFSMAWRTNVIFALSYKILSNDCSSFGLVIGIKRGREVQDLEIFSSYSMLVPRSVMQLQFCLRLYQSISKFCQDCAEQVQPAIAIFERYWKVCSLQFFSTWWRPDLKTVYFLGIWTNQNAKKSLMPRLPNWWLSRQIIQ